MGRGHLEQALQGEWGLVRYEGGWGAGPEEEIKYKKDKCQGNRGDWIIANVL